MYFLQYYISISIKNIMVMVLLGIVIKYKGHGVPRYSHSLGKIVYQIDI